MKALGLTFSFLSLVFSTSPGFSQEKAPQSELGIVSTTGTDVLLDRTIGLNPCRHLVKQGRYDLAFQKAGEIMGEQFSLKISEEFISFAFDTICQLEKKAIHKKSATIFNPPPIGFLGISRNEEARNMAINLPDKKKVLENVKAFDSIRETCVTLQKLLETSVKNSPDPQKNLRQLASIEKVIDYLVEVRTSYISYDVVSPHLYEAHRIAFIARGFFNDNEDELFRAARLLASGMHKDWIYETEESVQLQFAEVMDYLKANLSDSEWNRLLVETTLVPSLDESKSRGGKAWLNKNK